MSHLFQWTPKSELGTPAFLRGCECCLCSGLPLACQKQLHIALSFISTHRAKGKDMLWLSPEKNIGARGCAPAGHGVCSTTWCPPLPEIRLKPIPACMGTTQKVPPEGYSTGSPMHRNSWYIEASAGRYLRKHFVYCKIL